MADEESAVSKAAHQNITIPLNVAQWLGGGFLISLLSAGGSYVGSSSISPEVFALQTQQLERKLVELQDDVKELRDEVQKGNIDKYSRSEANKDLAEIRERLLALERKHPDIFNK